jgi:hypothetical protein
MGGGHGGGTEAARLISVCWGLHAECDQHESRRIHPGINRP